MGKTQVFMPLAAPTMSGVYSMVFRAPRHGPGAIGGVKATTGTGTGTVTYGRLSYPANRFKLLCQLLFLMVLVQLACCQESVWV